MHTLDRTETHRRFGLGDRRGGQVLYEMLGQKIIWQPEGFNFGEIRTEQELIRWCQTNPWVQVGNKVLQSLGFRPPSWGEVERLVEGGASTTSSWVYEDLVLLEAIRRIPGSAGVITVGSGNGAFRNSLDELVDSFKVFKALGFNEENFMVEMLNSFPRETWSLPPGFVRVPTGFIPVPTSGRFSLSAGMGEIPRLIFETWGSEMSWADFTAVQRYIFAQLINLTFGPKLPLTVVCLEDFILATTTMGDWTLEEYLRNLRSAASLWHESRSVRAINYPCQHCHDWHYLTSKGVCFAQEPKGVQVRKVCWLRPLKTLRLKNVFSGGAGLSGMGLYLAFGEIGKKFSFISLARDYSKGEVYQVLKSFLAEPTNGLYLFPVGAVYLYGTNTKSEWGLHSMIFWKILQRIPYPGRLVAQIRENLPVPLGEISPIWLELGKNGELKIQK